MTARRARALIESALAGTPYAIRALELLDVAERGNSTEACVVWEERRDTAHTLALVGLAAGSEGAGKIHLIIGPDQHIVAHALDLLRALNARFAMAEWPEDAPFANAIRMLREEGFVEEARIADYVRDGVALLFLRKDL